MPPISPNDWRRLEPFFDELLDLEPGLREARLGKIAGLSDNDRTQLRNLLAADATTNEQLDAPLPTAAAQMVAEAVDDPLIDEKLGAYRVKEEIGRGGMGVVYLGERTDGEFKQEVVIKVLRLGIDSTDTRRRFLQERQILADLDHPAIVRLLDGGFTADGRPYIVMNRIVGQRLDHYCDEQRLDIKSRVRLFLNVIEAVDHAHRNLIIHRDLKPSNVWVDEAGKVHLLDFGIAKIADDDAGPGMTATNHRLMTPEYASPEQVKQENITTASDVYQLGILLYKLLTGQFPYVLQGYNVQEMESRICSTDPIPASRAITTDSAAHQASSGQMKKTLRGDLDVILEKSLRKEPERRYLSAHELREDLIRWLSGERILARPNSVLYQTNRFVRRHPLVVSLFASAIVMSMVFTVFHVQRITTERDIARSESAQRKEVSDFLVNLLKVPDPTAAKGREITARELLADSYSKVDEELSDPETKARLLAVVGQVSENLGLYDQAGPALVQRLRYTAELYGERSLETATAALDLAQLWRLARMADEALGPAEKGLSIRRELLLADDLLVGEALKVIGMIHRDLREFELAETELREAEAIYEAKLAPDDRLRTTINIDLAYVLRTVGKVEEAEALYRGAISVMRERQDEFGKALPGALNNLAYLLRRNEELEEAVVFYREAITANETHYWEFHPSTLMFRNNLATTLQVLDRTEETRQELETIIVLQEHLTGPDHWQAGVSHRSLGYFSFQNGDFAAGSVEFEIAYDTFVRVLDEGHMWTAAVCLQLATCQYLSGEKAGAEEKMAWFYPLLDTEQAHADGNVRQTLNLMIANMPAGHDYWLEKLKSLQAPAE